MAFPAVRIAGVASSIALVGCLGWFAFSAATADVAAARGVTPDAALGPAASIAVTPAAHTGPADGPATAPTTAYAGIATLVDGGWADATAATTGIPRRALLAYAGASLAVATERPTCHLGWTTIAALGQVESGHGSVDGATLLSDGRTSPQILGQRLEGETTQAISDSDDGALDGDTSWDRAVGPLQFIPSTWATMGADGNADGIAEPSQIDDGSLAAARYLCEAGDLSQPDRWRAAVFSYNHLDSYVDLVAETANAYAARSQ